MICALFLVVRWWDATTSTTVLPNRRYERQQTVRAEPSRRWSFHSPPLLIPENQQQEDWGGTMSPSPPPSGTVDTTKHPRRLLLPATSLQQPAKAPLGTPLVDPAGDDDHCGDRPKRRAKSADAPTVALGNDRSHRGHFGKRFLASLSITGDSADVAVSFTTRDRVNALGERGFGAADIGKITERIQRKASLNYGDDVLLYEALDFAKSRVEGRHVVIPGSEKPNYELLSLRYAGADRVTTLDYRRMTVAFPNVSFQLVEDYWRQQPSPTVFDAAISFSNFEHDGLGRYGDPLQPEGDFAAMAEMHSMLRPKGVLILGLPIGRDCVCFNLHRTYGPLRLQRMFAGWTLLRAYGLDRRSPRHRMNPCSPRVVHGVFVLERECLRRARRDTISGRGLNSSAEETWELRRWSHSEWNAAVKLEDWQLPT